MNQKTVTLFIFLYATVSAYTHRKEHLTGFKNFVDSLKRSEQKQFGKIANNYIDKYLLKDLNKYIQKQKHDSVNVKIFHFAVIAMGNSGQITLDKGWMKGFSKLRRHRKTIIRKYGGTFKLKVIFIYDKLPGGYNYMARVNRFRRIAGITKGVCKKSKITLNFSIDSHNHRVDLNEIVIDIGNIEADFKGTLDGHLPNYMIDTYLPMVKVKIMSLVEKYMIEDLRFLIEQHNEYACEFINDCPR